MNFLNMKNHFHLEESLKVNHHHNMIKNCLAVDQIHQ
jgi:hypothetical protein